MSKLDQKRLRGEGREFSDSVRQQEYRVIMALSREFPVKVLRDMIFSFMVFISIDELLLYFREYGKAHHSMYGLISGMMAMAVSLLML